jgi:predicted NAD/FAD-binding protein
MDISNRFEAALCAPSPFDALRMLAEALKAEGMTQQEMYGAFDKYRERHADDQDETCLNVILDVMDCIGGWCAPADRIF